VIVFLAAILIASVSVSAQTIGQTVVKNVQYHCNVPGFPPPGQNKRTNVTFVWRGNGWVMSGAKCGCGNTMDMMYFSNQSNALNGNNIQINCPARCKNSKCNLYDVTEKEPTCKDAGVRVKKCHNCNRRDVVGSIPPLGCDWKDKYKAPTCDKAGYEGRECDRCGKVEIAILPAKCDCPLCDCGVPTCKECECTGDFATLPCEWNAYDAAVSNWARVWTRTGLSGEAGHVLSVNGGMEHYNALQVAYNNQGVFVGGQNDRFNIDHRMDRPIERWTEELNNGILLALFLMGWDTKDWADWDYPVDCNEPGDFFGNEPKKDEPKDDKPVVTPKPKGCENCEGNNANRMCDGRGCDGNGRGPNGGGNQQ